MKQRRVGVGVEEKVMISSRTSYRSDDTGGDLGNYKDLLAHHKLIHPTSLCPLTALDGYIPFYYFSLMSEKACDTYHWDCCRLRGILAFSID